MHWTFLEALLGFGVVFLGIMAIFAYRERRRRRVAPDSNILDVLERCWNMAHEHGSAEFCDEIQEAIYAHLRETERPK
jgi:hypothetical protein